MNTSRHASSDPRTIITPDAFSVAPNLVGLPLASPARRFVAIAIDLIFVAAFSALGWYLLGLSVVIAAFRAATRKGEPVEEGGGQVFTAFRVILGCFGMVVLLAVVVAISSIVFLNDSDNAAGMSDRLEQLAETEGGPDLAGLTGLIRGVGSYSALQRADNPEDAAAAVAALATEMMQMPGTEVTTSDLRATIDELAPEDSEAWWEDALDAGLARALASQNSVPAEEQAVAEGAEGLEPMTLDQALVAYAALVQAGEIPETAEAEALRREIISAVGADTLTELNRDLRAARRDLDTTEQELSETRGQLEDAENSGFFAIIRNFAESTGLLFGWGTVYMSLFTAWWNGQTIGKRMLGIRVVRLDGKPMNGWYAFERAGGYAAGFATGLLGFAQVYWDPNRMAIHDKVTETAVIRVGAPRVPGPWDIATPASARPAQPAGAQTPARPPVNPPPPTPRKDSGANG